MAIGDVDPERPPRPLVEAGRRAWEAARLLAARDAVVGELKAELATANVARVKAEVRAAKAARVLGKVWRSRRMHRGLYRSTKAAWDASIAAFCARFGERDAVVGELKAGLAARLAADAGSLGCLTGLYGDGGAGW